MIPGSMKINCPQNIMEDIALFINKIRFEEGLNLKALGIKTFTLDTIVDRIASMYNL